MGEVSVPLPQGDAVDARAVPVGQVGGEFPAERRALRHVSGAVSRRDPDYFTPWPDKVCYLDGKLSILSTYSYYIFFFVDQQLPTLFSSERTSICVFLEFLPVHLWKGVVTLETTESLKTA